MSEACKRFVVGISGASGAAYSLRLLELLLESGHEVHLVISDYGRRLLFDESGIRSATSEDLLKTVFPGKSSAKSRLLQKKLVMHPHKDVGAVIASGSFLHDGMVVIPCSSQSLGSIASGSGSNLLTRAAMVTLKERRPLILCHREMPLSLIDIENMRRLAVAGAVICSPNPGFYLHPKRVQDMVDFVVGKVLDLLRVKHDLDTRWEQRKSVQGSRFNRSRRIDVSDDHPDGSPSGQDD